MPAGWLGGRLVVGLRGGQHAAAAAAAGQQLRVWAMAAKRGGEALSPPGAARHKRRPQGGGASLDFISLSQTPPSSPPSPDDHDHDQLDLSSLIFIDTTPTPTPDAPRPPRLRDAPPPPATAAAAAATDSDIAVLYEGPRRNGTRVGGRSVNQQQRRACHTEARRGINTRAPAEVEVIDVDTVEDQHQHHQQEGGGVEQVEVLDSDDSDSEGRGSGGGGVEVLVDSDRDSAGGGSRSRNSSGGSSRSSSSSSSSNSGVRGEVVDVSGEDFVSLGAVSVRRLNNTTIDVSDEVLRRRRHLEELRPWERTGLGHHVARKGLPRGAVPLTVLSYNVLAQSLLRDNPGLYHGCEEEQLAWEYRWALLQHEVEGLQPDVLLLQEVEARHYHSHYLPWLTSRGFRGLYKKRTGSKPDGCAIFYNADAWRLAEHTTVEFRQPRAPAVLDRDNVGIIARLVPQRGGSEGVVVATTHLLYNPRRHDVKLAQVAVLLAELDRMCYAGQRAGQPQYCPVVLAGDLNAEPHSAVLSFLLDGRLQYEGLGTRTLTRHYSRGGELGPELLPPALGITGSCQHAALAQGRWLEGQRGPIISPADKRRLEEALIHLHHSDRPNQAPAATPASSVLHGPSQCPGWLSHALLLHSAYRRGCQQVTTFQDRWVCVDYLFYSRVRRQGGATTTGEGALKLLERLTLPTPREATLFSPMPSPVCPSDHFPLAARFMLQTRS